MPIVCPLSCFACGSFSIFRYHRRVFISRRFDSVFAPSFYRHFIHFRLFLACSSLNHFSLASLLLRFSLFFLCSIALLVSVFQFFAASSPLHFSNSRRSILIFLSVRSLFDGFFFVLSLFDSLSLPPILSLLFLGSFSVRLVFKGM